jgi:hypothetical protein
VYVVEKTEYHELLNFAKACDKFATDCEARNKLFEEYKVEADRLIDNQSVKNVQLHDDLASEKRKNHILYPILGIAAGFLGGMFLIKK